jgi:outer membrane receptor protein involved in Fe transport
MFKKLCLVLLLIPVIAFAQSSGKIAGVVVDKSTGEPLPGVNVILEETTLGASTDIDGYYVILNIPVSTYSIRANYIGYKDVVVEGIRVSASITTELNFDMEPTTLELEEAIVITAERPLVEKNVTQSISLVTAQEIESIPVRGFLSLVQTQNSVVVQDNAVYIRGGREEEVGYFVDGAVATNPMNQSAAVYVIQEAIEEFQVQAGGYNAEFGGANSGIIRSELKTGSAQYHFSVDVQTDKFTSEGTEFLGTSTYRDHIIVATLSGPVVNKNIRAFLAYENFYEGDFQRRFSEGFNFPNLIDTRRAPILGDTVDINYPNGFTPHQERDRHAFNGTLLFDFLPFRIRATGTYLAQDQQVDDHPMLRILNNRLQTDETRNTLLTLKGTYVINPKSYLEASVNYFNSTLERMDDYFGNDWPKYYDSLAVAQHTGGRVIYKDRRVRMDDYLLAGFEFEQDGRPRNFYRIEKNQYIGGRLDFVSQMGRHHEVKLGGDYRQHEIRHFDVQPRIIDQITQTAGATSIFDIPPTVMGAGGRVASYGYDNYGQEIDGNTTVGDSIYYFGQKKPVFAALYLQDKIEFNDLIINAGIRLDYYDMKDYKLISPDNAVVHPTTGYIMEDQWEKVDAFTQLSPRLGMSFPVSERTVFYAQYGKFIQMPELNDLYFGTADYRDQIFTGGNFFGANYGNNAIGPVGSGLQPIRTTSYEVGFRQQLSSVASFDVTGFYKNVQGQPTLTRIDPDPSGDLTAYNVIVNGDFATTQGLELRLTLRRINRLQSQVNYTLTSSDGTGSSEVSYIASIEQSSFPPKTVNPLDFAQTHVGSIILDYRFGKNDGGAILQQFGANFLLTFNSGHPYSNVNIAGLGQVSPYNAGVDYMNDTRVRLAKEPVNNSVTPWNFNVDMRLDKTFTVFRKLDATIYARVTNLFNTKNVINVYQLTGSADDDGFISNPELSSSIVNAPFRGEQYVAMYNAINITNGQSYWDSLNLQLYGHPRQIWLGIKLFY